MDYIERQTWTYQACVFVFRERREAEVREMEKREREREREAKMERERMEKQRAAEQAVHKHFEESLRLAQQKVSQPSLIFHLISHYQHYLIT